MNKGSSLKMCEFSGSRPWKSNYMERLIVNVNEEQKETLIKLFKIALPLQQSAK